ncbi:MAG: acyl-ACP--UDP-N-acetylglucosamine O-acyltransferase [Candidatus Binatia bacterium]|nr:acyl-ACP--UDP-N-acetylglucosamine O-acyltransferase [Candidatus Binatia bacterium]
MSIHPSAVIDPRAEIHQGAQIGPYVVVDGPVKIGRGTRVMAHAMLMGWADIGEGNEIHPGVVLGDAAQDLAYQGEESFLRVGNYNTFREHVQIHRGTAPGSSTTIGDHNFLMATAHVGHNCTLGSHIVMVNGALLGGYAEVGDRAFISAHCVVHQFVRVGELSLMRGLSGTSRDVPPYAVIDWQHRVRGVNVVGMKRAGFDEARIRPVKEAFRILFRKGRNLSLAIDELESHLPFTQEVSRVLDFIKSSKRGVCFGD